MEIDWQIQEIYLWQQNFVVRVIFSRFEIWRKMFRLCVDLILLEVQNILIECRLTGRKLRFPPFYDT